jgi:type III secretory pathway component EscR
VSVLIVCFASIVVAENVDERSTEEKIKLERQHQQRISELEDAFEDDRQVLDRERDALNVSFSLEKNSWQRKIALLKDEVSEDVARNTQLRLEVRFDF